MFLTNRLFLLTSCAHIYCHLHTLEGELCILNSVHGPHQIGHAEEWLATHAEISKAEVDNPEAVQPAGGIIQMSEPTPASHTHSMMPPYPACLSRSTSDTRTKAAIAS